jgi:hypothetical protein
VSIIALSSIIRPEYRAGLRQVVHACHRGLPALGRSQQQRQRSDHFERVAGDARVALRGGEAGERGIGDAHRGERKGVGRCVTRVAFACRLVGPLGLRAADRGVARVQPAAAQRPDGIDRAAAIGFQERAGKPGTPALGGGEARDARGGGGQARRQFRAGREFAGDGDRFHNADRDMLVAAHRATGRAGDRTVALDGRPCRLPCILEGRAGRVLRRARAARAVGKPQAIRDGHPRTHTDRVVVVAHRSPFPSCPGAARADAHLAREYPS